jgi:hypothetical protein
MKNAIWQAHDPEFTRRTLLRTCRTPQAALLDGRVGRADLNDFWRHVGITVGH